MHLPYMRVAIYGLTFLTYAYTGYGSHMIASLRDAIIAAEAVFGDVFKNAIYVARKFQTVHEVFDAAVEENCVYKCPNGARPVRNKFHTPTANGCGSLGIGIATEYLPVTEMDNCCDEHDMCYDTCNRDKELCDIEFKRCLYNYCDAYEKTAVGGDIMVSGCKGAAKMLFTATLTLGCKSYLDAQATSCYCGGAPAPPPPNSQQQRQSAGGQTPPQPSAPPSPGAQYYKDKYYKGKDNREGYREGGEYKNKQQQQQQQDKRYQENPTKNNNDNANQYPNNKPQAGRDVPQYGWKDTRDL